MYPRLTIDFTCKYWTCLTSGIILSSVTRKVATCIDWSTIDVGEEEEIHDLNVAETLIEFECYVEGLTHRILDTRVNYISMRLM